MKDTENGTETDIPEKPKPQESTAEGALRAFKILIEHCPDDLAPKEFCPGGKHWRG